MTEVARSIIEILLKATIVPVLTELVLYLSIGRLESWPVVIVFPFCLLGIIAETWMERRKARIG